MNIAIFRSRPAPMSPTYAGILCMLAAVSLFSAMDAGVKWLAPRYPISELLFFRSAFAFVPLAIWLHRDGGLSLLRTRRPGLHLLRSLMGLGSMCLFFLAYATMPLADAVAIGFTGPLFLTMLSIPLLGEQVGPRRWAAVAAGFVGVLLIVRPGAGVFGWEALIPLGGAFSYALIMILVRSMSRTESNVAIVFYFSLTCTLGSGAVMAFEWVTPSGLDLLLLIGLGLVGGTAQMLMTQAARLAPTSAIAPLGYVAMLWALLFGAWLFGEMPDSWTYAGAAIVVASGLYILHRERLRRARA